MCHFPPLFRGAYRKSNDFSEISKSTGSEKDIRQIKTSPVIQILRLFSCFFERHCPNVFQLYVYHITCPGKISLFSTWNTEETGRRKENKSRKVRKRLRSEWTTGDLEPWLTEKLKPVKKPSPLGFFICTVLKLGDAASICTYGFRGASVTKVTSTYLKFIHRFQLFLCKEFLCSAKSEAARWTWKYFVNEVRTYWIQNNLFFLYNPCLNHLSFSNIRKLITRSVQKTQSHQNLSP